jgi:cytosine deaminase
MDCLENAGRLKARDYESCVIYSTLSPCDMCTGAILLYKIPVVVIGENKAFKGPEAYSRKRGVKLIDLDLEECKTMMSDF